MNLPKLPKQILERVCEIMDVPLDMGLQSPQVLEACHCIESGFLVRIESPSLNVSVLQGEMPEA
jgi:hypothetical protein